MGIEEKKTRKKALSNEQSKEINTKKAKKRDYRKWANKYLKPGALPSVSHGFGEGKVLYCPHCKVQALKTTFKEEWTCNVCSTPCISMTKTEFQLFRESQEVE